MNIKRVLLPDFHENIEQHLWEILIDEISNKGLKKAFVILAIKELENNDIETYIKHIFDNVNISCEFFQPDNCSSPVNQVKNGLNLYKSSQADFIVTVGADSMEDIVNSICILATNSQYLNKILIGTQQSDKLSNLCVYYNNLKYHLITK